MRITTLLLFVLTACSACSTDGDDSPIACEDLGAPHTLLCNAAGVCNFDGVECVWTTPAPQPPTKDPITVEPVDPKPLPHHDPYTCPVPLPCDFVGCDATHGTLNCISTAPGSLCQCTPDNGPPVRCLLP